MRAQGSGRLPVAGVRPTTIGRQPAGRRVSTATALSNIAILARSVDELAEAIARPPLGGNQE